MLNGSIPGINLLQVAQTVIAKQTFTYYAYLGRTDTDIGTLVTSYAPGVVLTDSIQPIPKALMREMGLSMERTHIMLYTSTNVQTIIRGTSSDIIEFAGRRYQALESNDWVAIDGWEGLIFVDIGSSSDDFPGVIT